MIQIEAGFEAAYAPLSTGKIEITLNLPPIGGKLTITPLSGTALITDFTITAENFEDPDQPLLYSFGVYRSFSSL